ncbi:uncharacterized protein LOC130645344 [Hydractinia symbiolongicarpus]|uniref:uncharacterized protein LOC130645344 n=1 Tax=Hydractinia symbiolongicarpus TaxID=13093 RepID=UPI002549E82B|nr:uncharacterized protein LOC130645344 [Hydractinia symbiolongicarpus]
MTTEIGRCIKTSSQHIDIDNTHHVVQGLSVAALVLEGLVVILHALFICYAVQKTGFVIISVLMIINGILACVLTGLFVLKRHDWLKDTPSRVLYPVYCYTIAAAATILLAVGLLIYVVKLTNNNSNNNNHYAVQMELQDI